MKRIVILTGNEPRHIFFRRLLSINQNIQVIRSFSEEDSAIKDKLIQHAELGTNLREIHLELREQCEKDFFELFNNFVEDRSEPVILQKGEINNSQIVDEIVQLSPDLIIAYGCSIIKSDLLQIFKGRFINIHLGLSPYYRGSGTNFWPFVYNELSCVGVTFMHIDEGIDTGEIIHQTRAVIQLGDNIHTIGCRLIKDMVDVCVKLIINMQLSPYISLGLDNSNKSKYFSKKDFTERSVELAYENLRNGMIENYILNKVELDKQFPIVEKF